MVSRNTYTSVKMFVKTLVTYIYIYIFVTNCYARCTHAYAGPSQYIGKLVVAIIIKTTIYTKYTTEICHNKVKQNSYKQDLLAPSTRRI